ncbi:MurR/RpiR family transcriptional regulator [Aquamicrobium zhengzhouense]|uniref:MurR/RpiR family transcriptional regulator n=1 Tax=Aquamicrobium zhengzhouense TaxID=2781738 RepID=A0ABS0S8N7_9HYPH|nr:MurR/RpiR family transcriptional regulator [Aquamicrobium zhengzhouense]MBI1619663.1 MurR/RpiR family transcriptional regulator [Aquamicrobium zhengzhouense]
MNIGVAELIAERIDSLPAGERRAAQVLIANYPVTGLKTVAEFSAQAGVSPPTILRFVARLGFHNYADFQARLQDELAAQLQSPLSRATQPNLGAKAPPFLSAAIQNLHETYRHLSEAQLTAIVRTLSNTKGKVFLIGGRFTDPIAAYMAAHMAIIRPGVLRLSGQESNWRDRLLDMGKSDVVIIFDIRRYQDSLLRLAEAAHKRGSQVVLFTDQWLSPITRFSRHVIAGRTAVPSAWDSSASLFVVAEMLIAELTRALDDESAHRIREMEKLRGS